MNIPFHRLLSLKQRLTAAVLLVAVLFTLTPSGFFHHHHKEDACEQNAAHVENDPCHVTLHHADEAGLVHCSHKVHMEADGNECYICQYLLHHHGYAYIAQPEEESCLIALSSSIERFHCTAFVSNAVHTPFNKGPPAIKM